ncbi:chloride channel protein [Leptospira ilyithenensis]|uniref:Chloride channel protein n=1 Tax=Leptospira ilyithenensis TaxID=2484901 RepID=A0A4R9LNX3_9LEPT|nr:chloride channel protein [Leptospira ilyithenensis]TGN06931.1 chloride channel protein [Leptospira ilyithenensis]
MVFGINIRSLFSIQGPKSIYVYSLLIGLLSGFGAYGFNFILAFVESVSFGTLIGFDPGVPAGDRFFSFEHGNYPLNNLWLFFLPAIGGLLAGIITYFFCPEAAGGGTDSLIHSFHYNEGKIHWKVPFYKAIVTILTLGSGGSGGKEGPTAQIGAGFGSTLGNILGVGARARRTLMLAGTAGGLGAIFRAPLGGAMTAVEMVYKEDIESDSLVPCILSSVTAYLTYSSLAGRGSIFEVQVYTLHDYRHIPIYLFMGLLCFAVGYLFVRFYHFIQDFFTGLKIPNYYKPAIGGLVVGAIALFFPEVLGSGFGLLQKMVDGEDIRSFRFGFYGPLFLLSIALFKVVSTSFTVGSGSSGGLLGPSFFIGGMLGAFVGSLSQMLFPAWNIQVFPFMLVGMGSFFAGVSRAPIAGMVMVCDMIGSYELLPPLMIVSVLAAILSSKMSIYRNQVTNRFLSPSHHWDMNQDIMDRIKISQHFSEFRKYAVISNSLPLTELQTRAPGIQASDFVIVDQNETYKGIVSLRKNRILPEHEESLQKLIMCEDILESVPSLSPSNSLGEGLRILLQYDVDKVAVENEFKKCLGYLRYIDFFHAYQAEIRMNSRKN